MPAEGTAAATNVVRVTHVILYLGGGGMETLVGAMAQRFAGTPVQLSIITLNGELGRIGESIRERVEHIEALRPARTWSMFLPLGLARAIRRCRPDVVHLHSGAWFKGALAARLAGVRRVIYTEHGLPQRDVRYAHWLLRAAAAMTTTIVAVSERLDEHLRGRFGSGAGIVTIRNGVDVEHFSPGEPAAGLRDQLGIPADALVIGSVGRLERVKAYDVLLRAFARLRETGRATPEPHLVLCGTGREADALRALAAELDIAAFVRFPGWTTHPLDYYRLFDVFALSSASEGAPLSLMEAMACGAVPVVTNVGATGYIVGPELADLVVPPGDAEALATALGRALESPERLSALGARARARIVSEYNLDHLIDAYRSLYSSDLDAPNRMV